MKKLLLILFCFPLIGFGQQTYVPDDNFEQALINMGYDNVLDNYVQTSNINMVTNLNVNSQNISDLTGVEDFTALWDLRCDTNQLTSLDVSQNTALTDLSCQSNQLTSLDVSSNTALTYLYCERNQLTSLNVSNNTPLIWLTCQNNQLTSLDVSQNTILTYLVCGSNPLNILDVSNNTALIFLWCSANQLTSLDVSNNVVLWRLFCYYNQLTSLDVSNNIALAEFWCYDNQLSSLNLSNNTDLTELYCQDNQLTSLDVRNGNNMQMGFDCTNNPNLECINVDDVAWSTANWTVGNAGIDPQHYFSNNCTPSAIQEHTTNKELLKVTDLLGRDTEKKRNTPLFYIYNDGTVEKKIIIE